MAQAVQMPKQGNTVEECLLVEWKVKEGDSIKEGDVICSIETDKSSFDVESTASGVVLKLLAAAGDLVPVLSDILLVGDAGEKADVAPAPVAAKPDAAGATAESVPDTKPVLADKPASAPVPVAAASSDSAFKPVSPRARKLAEKLGVDAAAIPGTGIHGRVTSVDIQGAVDSGAAVKASPLAKAVMAETGQMPVAATGIGGLARARDLGVAAPGLSVPKAQAVAPTVVPYKGIRKLIGQRMLQSLADHAQLTHNTSADASGLMAMRKIFKDNAKDMGLPNVSINDLICWVVCQTLPSFPEMNAQLDLKAAAITQHHDVNLGFAVDTPRGLLVPVVQGANRMSLVELSKAMSVLAEDCRKGSINPDHLAGGTFTISNLGSVGIESFTPIINGDQVGILGVCAITQTAAPTKDGGYEFRPRIGLSLTYDHQAVDGAPASRFLQAVAKGLENVQTTLALYGSL